MKDIRVNNQEELDQIDINFNGIVKIFGTNIIVKTKYKYPVEACENSNVKAWGNSRVTAWSNARVEAWGNSRVTAWGNSSVVARDNSSVEARDNSSVTAWSNSIVVARDNSSVVARDNSSVEALDNSRVIAWNNSSVEAWDNSSVEALNNSRVTPRDDSGVVARGNSRVIAQYNSSVKACDNSRVIAQNNSRVEACGNSSVKAQDNSSVVAQDNSSVVARGNSSVEAWGNSSVEARDNSSVVARENVCVRISSPIRTLSLFGFSVLFKPFDLKFKFKKEKTCIVQEIKSQAYLDREGIKITKGYVILYKKVSKDFKTQENTNNETSWQIGSSLSHPSWNPFDEECGAGKYHACSRPYFCDEFRNQKNDQYIAIKIKTDDLYEWDKPQYPHKIAFSRGKVLYQVDRFGKKIAD